MPGWGKQAQRFRNTSLWWVQGQRDALCIATAQRGDPDSTSTERGERQSRLPRGGELCPIQRSFQDRVRVNVSVMSNSLQPHGMLEWVAIPFCRGSSWSRDWTWVSSIAGRLLNTWTARGAPFQDKEKLTGENISGRRAAKPQDDWGKQTNQATKPKQNEKFIIIRRLKEEHVETGEGGRQDLKGIASGPRSLESVP